MRDIEQGSGKIIREGEKMRLLRREARPDVYSNAQQDDYQAGFLHQAPVRMRLQATFSHPQADLRGTAGFGFWNVPFAPGSKGFHFPKTAWFFFGSPPLNLPFAMGVPGNGFKAATMDAVTPLFFALLPTAPLGFLIMRNRFLYDKLWPIAQRAIKVSEKLITADITRPHFYQIDWLKEQVIFAVDDQVIHTTHYSPTGKLGAVVWIDNQYAIVTPKGQFKWGLVAESNPQWIDIEHFQITPLA